MFAMHRDGSYRWQGLGAAQEAVVTTSASSEPTWIQNINTFLDSPAGIAAGRASPAVEPKAGVDWVFWGKTVGIAGALVVGFLLLTKVRG